MRRLVAVVLLGVAVVVAIRVAGHGASSSASRVRTALVDQGPVIESVEATGTVQPLVLVQVGTQVSGVVDKLFKDWNDHVESGETIALIDSRRYAAQVVQDDAALAHARADLERVEALLWQSERDLDRQRQLAGRKLVAESDLDAAVAAARSLKAQRTVCETAVLQARAQLDIDRINLAYCTITSPIDGVVVSRAVDTGQTVAASFQAPVLFTIANDLRKVQVQASVPEADIGRLRRGGVASFRVDAYTDRTFHGRVRQVRLGSQTNQNVVTYTVLVDAANDDQLLLPGMTASVSFEVSRVESTLRVPTSALRFEPPAEALEPGTTKTESGSAVFVRAGGWLRAVPVRAGISDGIRSSVAPIESGSLAVGAEIVTGLDEAKESPGFFARLRGQRGGS
jgi:HlyD family secretion protein